MAGARQAAVGVFALVLMFGFGCGGSTTTPTPVLPTLSGPRILAGTVVGNQDRHSIAGATLTLTNGRGQLVATTDGQGRFTLDAVPDDSFFSSLEAPGYLAHAFTMHITTSHDDIVLDLIPDSPPFDLNFYREFARDALRAPAGFPRPTNPWTVAPSFYLKTVTEDTGEPVPTEIVAAIRRVFANSVPELSGGRLAMAAFETGTEPRPEHEGWVNVTFARDPGPFNGRSSNIGGNSGLVKLKYWDPNDPLYPLNHRLGCEQATVETADHEIVHVMGFYHTTSTSADFHSGQGCPGLGRPARTLYHAAVMYSRPPGNMDPDIDPASFGYPSAAHR